MSIRSVLENLKNANDVSPLTINYSTIYLIFIYVTEGNRIPCVQAWHNPTYN